VAAIDLEKKAEKVGIILAKKGITQAPTMRVGVAIDISGSMGSLEPRAERLQPVDGRRGEVRRQRRTRRVPVRHSLRVRRYGDAAAGRL
jgi:hypothetical protein